MYRFGPFTHNKGYYRVVPIRCKNNLIAIHGLMDMENDF